MCTVYSALSGATLTVMHDCAGKTGKEVKQFVAAQIGISRFRQRFLVEDGSSEIQDEEILASAAKVQLVLLEFELPEAEEDQRMMLASFDNDAQTLETLLQRPRDPNVADDIGKTPLHYAAANGHIKPMRMLLEAGDTKDARDTQAAGWTPFLLAAWRGHVDSVSFLIEAGVDKDFETLNKGKTALHLAARHGHLEVVHLLIQAGLDMDRARRDNGATPMFMAAVFGNVEVVQSLIDARADSNKATTDHFGATPMYIAADKGNVKVVQLLIEAGADSNKARIDTGATPMFVAAEKGHIEVVHILVEAGANRNKPTQSGTTPLLVAAQQGHIEVFAFLDYLNWRESNDEPQATCAAKCFPVGSSTHFKQATTI